MELLIFQIEDARYGLALRNVQEVLRAVAITRLPSAPSAIEGVINLRGQLAPVFNLRRRFGLPEKNVEPSEQFIIAWAGDRTVALRVECVLGMAEVDSTDIADVKDVAPQAEYVSGVAKLPDGLVLIHDLQTFLSHAETEALDRALAAAGPKNGEE